MNKQQSNQMASLRKKLIAAIAMLLVACIMTVSSTYAWFTLSTAPEVKGISTNIGANGNLEIALGTVDSFIDGNEPSSGTGTSIDVTSDYKVSNITWGNLIDLSEGYGLDKINLYPSQLNFAEGSTTEINRTSPLKFPKYGADGRVTTLDGNTLLGQADATGVFTNTAGTEYAGVSAVGSSSSVSKRAFAVKNGKLAIMSYKRAAQDVAIGIIANNGDDLAMIALNKALQDGDMEILQTMITDLTTANNNISESIKAAVQVFLASDQSGLDDTKWEVAAGLAEGKDIVGFIDALKTAADSQNVTIPTELNSVIDQYKAIKQNLINAKAELDKGSDWANVSAAVAYLLKTEGIKFQGLKGSYTLEAVKAEIGTEMKMDGEIAMDLMDAVTSNQFKILFSADSGVFGDIATLTGSYTTSMTFPTGVSVGGIPATLLNGRPVVVESGSTLKPKGDLDVMAESSVIAGLQAPTASSDPNAVLTNTYGYLVDLLFRTNAADSQLLLQTDAAGRIYENGSEDTQGNGANVTFTITAEYTKAKIDALAKAFRVVFMNKDGEIIAVAGLNTDDNGAIVGTVTGNAYKVNLYLYNYTLAGDGALTLGTKKTDAALCDMPANLQVGISALVYLEGKDITNKEAGVFDSLQSTMNLQFSSSVDLTPMDYSDLQGQGQAGETPAPEEPVEP